MRVIVIVVIEGRPIRDGMARMCMCREEMRMHLPRVGMVWMVRIRMDMFEGCEKKSQQ